MTPPHFLLVASKHVRHKLSHLHCTAHVSNDQQQPTLLTDVLLKLSDNMLLSFQPLSSPSSYACHLSSGDCM